MKIFKVMIFGLLVFTMGLVSTPKTASAFEAEGDASVDVLSTYVWRGQNLGGNEGVVQPSMTISGDNLSVNLWANYDEEEHEHNETDLTINYNRSMEGYSFDMGFIYYALEGADNDTKEIYLGVALEDRPLSPSLTYYLDIDEGSGSFVVLAIGQSLVVNDKAGLDLGASISMNFENDMMQTDINLDGNIDEFNGLYNAEFSAAFNYEVVDGITVSPKIAYSFAVSNEAQDTLDVVNSNGESDVLYGGVGVSVSF